jgi:hypothetical protein
MNHNFYKLSSKSEENIKISKRHLSCQHYTSDVILFYFHKKFEYKDGKNQKSNIIQYDNDRICRWDKDHKSHDLA